MTRSSDKQQEGLLLLQNTVFILLKVKLPLIIDATFGTVIYAIREEGKAAAAAVVMMMMVDGHGRHYHYDYYNDRCRIHVANSNEKAATQNAIGQQQRRHHHHHHHHSSRRQSFSGTTLRLLAILLLLTTTCLLQLTTTTTTITAAAAAAIPVVFAEEDVAESPPKDEDNNNNNNNNLETTNVRVKPPNDDDDDDDDSDNISNTSDSEYPSSDNTSTTFSGSNNNYSGGSSISSSSSSISSSSSSNDAIEDSLYDPIQADPDCTNTAAATATGDKTAECWAPPESTIETTTVVVVIDATCSYGGNDPFQDIVNDEHVVNDDDDDTICRADEKQQQQQQQVIVVDKHWGSDPTILRMRDQLRQTGSGISGKHSSNNKKKKNASSSAAAKQQSKQRTTKNDRPPIFLMPGLASTRLVAWKYKACPQHPLLSDIKVQDYVWLNINILVQMGTIDGSCFQECLQLGWNQSDTDHWEENKGCKLRPDEGLDAISSLSPGGIGSQLLVGGTNTVYAWLIQWLADNLGYDVSNIVGLPYDWRLSPDKMQERDGFLTLTRRRMEAAVQTNGKPGIMVAHSMGNIIFRYFLEWLRSELRREAYETYKKQAKKRRRKNANHKNKQQHQLQQQQQQQHPSGESLLPGWMQGAISGWDGWLPVYHHSSSATAASVEEGSLQENGEDEEVFQQQLMELARIEGDANWYEWIETHIWTYVGLSAPLLGAVNPLRAVISGENMGLPITDEVARLMELSFGSTHTVNPISSKEGFCDRWEVAEWDEEPSPDEKSIKHRHADYRLACLDDIQTEIEVSAHVNPGRDPWENSPALKNLLLKRSDWDSDFPMIDIVQEFCEAKERSPCQRNETVTLGPLDAQSGNIFTTINGIWKEQDEPMMVKRDQLKESFWDTEVSNILNRTWDRPLIKHVVIAYGVDIPTEVGYRYRKTATEGRDKNHDEYDGCPHLESVLWETAGGRIDEERMDSARGSIADILLLKKKPKRVPAFQGRHRHSGDGSVPYLSLSWAHTWLLHSIRALRHSGINEGPANPLETISISHRPKGAMEWEEGPPPKRIKIISEQESEKDTGTSHPHGTKYKPEMIRFYSNGTSRTTGIEYTTTVIEAIGVEHKETTRNYDILAAAFTDVLKFMHDDLEML